MTLIDPISEDNPFGVDYKHEDLYIEIEIEIEKNFNISNTEETHWDIVILKCENILTNYSKDLKILSYWLYAQWQLNGWASFFEALETYASIIEKYTTNLYPVRNKRKLKVLEWLENLLEHSLLDSLETFTQDQLDVLDKNLVSLAQNIPLMIESEYDFLNTVKKENTLRINSLHSKKEEETKQLALQKEEDLKRHKENEALNEADKLRRSKEANILEKLSTTNNNDTIKNLPSLKYTEIEKIAPSIIDLSKSFLDQSPSDYISYKMLFSLGEILIVKSLNGTVDNTDLIPSSDITFAVRKLEDEKVSLNQLNVLIEQILLRPTWIEGYYIISKILYKLGKTKDAIKLENMIFYFLYKEEKVLSMQIGDQQMIPENILSWLQTKVLSLGNSAGGSAEYQQAYQKVLKVKKEQSQQNALTLLEEYFQKAQSEEERFRWRLLFVDFALEIGDKKLALALLKELEKIIETYKINLWQPELAINTYEMLLKPFFTQELNNESKERIYNKLSILDLQKIIKQ